MKYNLNDMPSYHLANLKVLSDELYDGILVLLPENVDEILEISEILLKKSHIKHHTNIDSLKKRDSLKKDVIDCLSGLADLETSRAGSNSPTANHVNSILDRLREGPYSL